MLRGRGTLGEIDLGPSLCLSLPGLVIATKPPNLATCCCNHLLDRPPSALSWGSPQGCGEGAKAPGGTGDSPAGGKSRAVALSPSPAARADWILKKATRTECQFERRAAGGRRGGDQDAGAPAGPARGAQLGPPPRPPRCRTVTADCAAP